jgi:hypothetical protein
MEKWLPDGRLPTAFELELVRVATSEHPEFCRARSYRIIDIGRERFRVKDKDHRRANNRFLKVRKASSLLRVCGILFSFLD